MIFSRDDLRARLVRAERLVVAQKDGAEARIHVELLPDPLRLAAVEPRILIGGIQGKKLPVRRA